MDKDNYRLWGSELFQRKHKALRMSEKFPGVRDKSIEKLALVYCYPVLRLGKKVRGGAGGAVMLAAPSKYKDTLLYAKRFH
jgi:hypothetical protein